ncbi:MAG: permease [Candidatus Rifleibacteriota bacterium]
MNAVIEAENQNQKGLLAQLEFVLPRGFLLLMVMLALFGGRSPELKTFSVIFISILFEALPFMLIGSLAGGFIEEFIPKEKLAAYMPAGSFRAVFIGAAIGFVFPVCECAIVPVVRRLLRKGVPFSAAIAYLIAGPIVNPLVAASTAVAYFYNWKIVGLRLGLGYIAAVLVGFLVNKLVPESQRFSCNETRHFQTDEHKHTHEYEHKDNHNHAHSQQHDSVDCKTPPGAGCACCSAHSLSWSDGNKGFIKKIHHAIRHGANDFLEVACFLVAGAFFAAGAQTFINRQLIMSIMSETWLSIFIMMFLAVALNLCSEADAFVASSFRNLVGLPGQLGFLVLGPMFDIKLFFMYFSVFSKRTAITLAVVTIAVVYLLVWVASNVTAGMTI